MPVTLTPTKPLLATGFDTGLSNTDAITGLNTPTIIGTAVPGSLVTLYDTDGTTVLGQATAAANGSYAINLASLVVIALPQDAQQNAEDNATLDDGVHELTVTAASPGSDPSGPSVPLTLTIDTQLPDSPTAPKLAAGSDTGSSALDGVTSATILTVTGQSEPGATVVLTDGSTAVGQAVVAVDGSYTITSETLAAGAHALSVIATDIAGNASKPSGVTTVTIDTTAPDAPPAPTLAAGSDTGVLRTDGITSDTTPVVTGTAEAGATLKLMDDDGTVSGHGVAGSDGFYAITSSTLLNGAHALTVIATDVAGNVSAASAPLDILIDTTRPTATSTAAVVTASAPSVTFTIHFNEPITDRHGISPSDFRLVTTGTAYGDIESVSGSGQDGLVTVDGLGGSGTVAIEFAPGSEILNRAGTKVVLTSTQAHDVDGTEAGDTEAVSAGPSGVVGPGQDPSPSKSGHFVAFDSTFNSATGLSDVYLKDMVTDGLTRISEGPSGPSNGSSSLPSLSASGSVVVFVSNATNLTDTPTPTGQTNVYVAFLKPADPASGDSVTLASPIQLVSAGNGTSGSSIEALDSTGDTTPDKAVVSADGTTVVFSSAAALVPNVIAGVKNVYAYTIATGALTLISSGTGTDEYGYVETPDEFGYSLRFAPIADRVAGQGGDFDSTVSSVSADGTVIAYQSYATDQGSGALPTLNASETGPPLRSYVYNTKTGAVTVLDGSGSFGGGSDVFEYQTFDPQLSADGAEVTYVVGFGVSTQAIFQRNLVTGVVTQLTGTTNSLGYGDTDDNATLSTNGSYLAYVHNALGANTDEPYSEITVGSVSHPVPGTPLGGGFQPIITANANAVTYVSTLGTDYVAYEATLGVTAGIDPIAAGDDINAAALGADSALGTLAITGDTNAPVGSVVSLQLGQVDGSPGPVLTGSVTAAGVWVVLVPVGELSGDGTYRVVVTVAAPSGQSAQVIREFTVDTLAPATPDAPKLDAGSDTGLAHDGTVSDSDTPTVTGNAEAGATVTLIDLGGLSPGVVLGTGIADSNGVYAIVSAPLTQGAHELAVKATDDAGNIGAVSAALALNIDTIVPDAPQSPSITSVSVVNPSGDGRITTETTPTLAGTAIPGALVTLYDTDGVAVLGTAIADAKGHYSISANSLTDGLHVLTVTATDPAGNVSAISTSLDLTVDTLPPQSPVITSLGGPITAQALHTTQVDVNGTAEPGSTVTLIVDGDSLVSGRATVDQDGTYTIDGTVAPGVHKLTVIATDAVGNASQPSPVTLVTVAGAPLPISGAPISGKAVDGYIAGATVFADANGNGVLDPGEVSSITDGSGRFGLYSALAPLVLTGGVDTGTGLALPGAFTAPAGSSALTPLTTFLSAYMAATGETAALAIRDVARLLALHTGSDVRSIDPIAQALAGTADALVASTKLMDMAVVFSAAITEAGVSRGAAFSAVFTALGQAALSSPGALDLDSQTSLVSILNAALVAAGTTLASNTVSTAALVASAGNTALDNDVANNDPMVAQYAQALDTVEQGKATPALVAAGSDANALLGVNNSYTGYSLTLAVYAAQAVVFLPAPILAVGSDTGVSARDNITADTTPVFTGTASPNTLVLLITQPFVGSATVLGSGVADANGSYRIAASLLSGSLFNVTAIEAPVGASTVIGSTLTVSSTQTPPSTAVFVQSNVALYGAPQILDASYVAAPGDDATHTVLHVTGQLAGSQASFVALYADGGATPVASGYGAVSYYGLQTIPLANGTHSLVVTQTLFDGTVLTSAPFTATVAAPSFFATRASAAGPIVGGYVGEANALPGLSFLGNEFPAPVAITGIDGTFSAASAPSLYIQERQSSSGSAGPVQETVFGGLDTATGLPSPGPEAALPGSAEITPATSLAVDLPYFYRGNPTDVTAANARVASFLGFAGTDLATADPLAMAEAGNPALLLKNIEILDSATVIGQFIADPYGAIGSIYGGTYTLPSTAVIDFTSAATATRWLENPYYNIYTRGDFTAFALIGTILAASNAAIEAHAQTASGVSDSIAFAFAAERLLQSVEMPALQSAYADLTDAARHADLQALVQSYTGTNLTAAITQAETRTVQVTSFVPASAQATTAAVAHFTLTFSSPVSGVVASDFTVAGLGVVGARIAGVTPIAGSSGASYDVSVATGAGQGTLSVTFSGAGILHADGRTLTTGQFGTPTVYTTDSINDAPPNVLQIADLTGDGIADIVELSNDGLTVYRGLGGGAFAAGATIATGNPFGQQGNSLVLADVNGDGTLDAITTSSYGSVGGPTDGSFVSVQLGNGDGTFGQPILTFGGKGSTGLAAGDFNGDGKTDLVVANTNSGLGGSFQILLGNGDGTFRQGVTIRDYNYNGRVRVATADLNGDGKLDLVGSGFARDSLSIELGNGDGTFTAAPSPSVTGYGVIAIGDLNGDGIPDIVSVNADNAILTHSDGTTFNESGIGTVLLGNGDGTFRTGSTFALPTATGGSPDVNYAIDQVSIGDIDGDGRVDVVVVGDDIGDVVLLGNGDGTLQAPYSIRNATSPNELSGDNGTVALGDLNGDGRTDLAGGGRTITSSSVSSTTGLPTAGVAVYLNAPQTVLPSTSSTLVIDRSPLAQPVLSQASGPTGATLTQHGTAYTLDLGTLAQGSAAAPVTISLTNAAGAPADALEGLFTVLASAGYVVTGGNLPSALRAGQSYAGLTIAPDTSLSGVHTQTITFAPQDVSDTTTTYATLADTDQTTSTTTSVDGANVVAELPTLTLTITDAVGAAVPLAALGVQNAVALPNVRVGDVDIQALALANTAVAGSPNLDVTATASGGATVSGAVTQLAPGGNDAVDLVVGLGTATAGAVSGTVTLSPVSDTGSGVTLASKSVAVSGTVFRTGVASVSPVTAVLHVGDPGLVSIKVANTAAADGYSENLAASILASSLGVPTISANAAGILVAAGNSDSSLGVTVSTGATGVVTGTATLALASTGAGAGGTNLDGLAPVALPSQAVPITVTVENYAQAALSETVGGVTRTGGTLDLGTIQQGSAPVTISLAALNSATGPADLLSGSFTATGPGSFATALTSVAGIGAGQSGAAGTVTFATGTAGTFAETITFNAMGSNSSGYTGALAPQTLTITGTVAAVTVGAPAPAVGLPSISGALAGQAVADTGTLAPFAGVTIADTDAGTTEALTITLTAAGVVSDADGILSGRGLTKIGIGTYTLAVDTAGAVTAALDALRFTPTAKQVAPGQSVTTGISIGVTDGDGAVASNATTSVVATVAVQPPIKVTQDGLITYLPDGSVFGTGGGTNTTDFTSAGGSITAGGNDTVYAGAGATRAAIQGSAIVIGAGGALTVVGGAGTDTVFAGAGGLVYTGGSGTGMVMGGGHSAMIQGGTGGGQYFGGGNASITAGAGGTSIVLGGDGDTMSAVGPGRVLFGITGGDASFSSLGATGESDFFGQTGSGAMSFITGAGTNIIGLGQGSNTVTLGAGTAVVFGNTGTTAATTVTAGTGTEEIAFGGSTMDMVLAAAAQPRNLFLFDFAPGADHVHLQGFAPGQIAAAVSGQTQIGPGTTMALSDGTVLWFMNNSHVDPGFFR